MKLLDFYAYWCGPCKTLVKTLEEVRRLYPQLIIAKYDVEEYEDMANNLGIISLPTLILMKDDKEVSKQTGSISLAEIQGWLDKFV